MDISEWLGSLGLGQYAPAFAENAVNWDVLSGLTADDLKEIGVAAVGDRRRLLKAIARLSPAESTIAAAPPTAPAIGERRQLSVMFCDLVGSTALAARLDPEDLRDVIGAYHRIVAREAGRFGGFLAKYMGDGVLVYFGYPKAQEDDAERAVRAGLSLIERVPCLDTAARLEIRIGIATGLVVVGDLIGEGAAQERGVVGETPNLAARLQAMAEPNTLLIGETARRLVGDLFECRDLGAVELRGVPEPVRAWQVLRPSAIESRFEALHSADLLPLVGREDELDLLLRRWRRAAAGEGQLVLLSGEPGIGKSRLSAELQERLRQEPHIRLRYFCSPHHRDSALYPFISQLERAVAFDHGDTPAERLDKLEAVVAEAGDTSLETIAAMADLLGIPAEERYPSLPQDPQRRRELTLAALLGQFEGLAKRLPILLLFEDAQWADSTSLELLDRAVERVDRLPVLVIVNFRPEFAPPWVGQANVAVLALSRLTGRDAGALAGSVAGKRLPPEILDRIVERTDGIPLFVEECTKSLLEGGLLREKEDEYVLAGPLPPLAIPSSLRDLLMARLDRLAQVKEVAQIGAALGREFSYELLAAVGRRSEAELRLALDQLMDAGLVFRRSGEPPRARYVFKHALVQDAAYSTLLRARRQQLHARIAKAFEDQFPEVAEAQPEVLARHQAEAGLVESSIRYWEKAAQRSAARSALAEAAAQYQNALDQIGLLQDSHERQLHELALRSALGATLQVAKGHGATETGENYARARKLWERMDSPSEFSHVAHGQSRYHMFRGELDLALQLDEALLALCRDRRDTPSLILCHWSLARIHELAGRFNSSLSHAEAGISLYDPIDHGSLIHRVGFDPYLSLQGDLGLALFCLGFPERGFERCATAIGSARKSEHSPSLAISLAFGANLLTFIGQHPLLPSWADELVALSVEQGFPHYHAQGTIYSGWAKIEKGDLTEGVWLLRGGLREYGAIGPRARVTFYLTLLAAACAIGGQTEQALAHLDDAAQIIQHTGDRWVEAELYRQRGQLLLDTGDAVTAERYYRKAIGIAQEQEAKLWELRATVSLARLWGEQGRRSDAIELIAPVYRWFSEGFDTPDLKEAKALLDNLA